MGKFKPTNQIERIKRSRTYHQWIAKAENQINNLDRYKTEHTEPYSRDELRYLRTITINIRSCLNNALHHAKCPNEQKQYLSDKIEIFTQQLNAYKNQKNESNLLVTLKNKNTQSRHSTKKGFVYDEALVKERRERKKSNTTQLSMQTEDNQEIPLDLNILPPIQRPISQAKTVTLFGHTFTLNNTNNQPTLEIETTTLSL